MASSLTTFVQNCEGERENVLRRVPHNAELEGTKPLTCLTTPNWEGEIAGLTIVRGGEITTFWLFSLGLFIH